jgi:hypothetical protein
LPVRKLPVVPFAPFRVVSVPFVIVPAISVRSGLTNEKLPVKPGCVKAPLTPEVLVKLKVSSRVVPGGGV